MCHMLADTLDELHDMADKLGISRKHFQSKSRYPHYDICRSKHQEALKLSSKILLSRKDIIEKAKALKSHTEDTNGTSNNT